MNVKFFEEQDILKWMDNQIKAYNLATKELSCGDIMINNISVYDKKIHVRTEGLLEIIKIPALIGKVNLMKRKDKDYPYMIVTFYKGFKFFALLNEEEYQQYRNTQMNSGS